MGDDMLNSSGLGTTPARKPFMPSDFGFPTQARLLIRTSIYKLAKLFAKLRWPLLCAQLWPKVFAPRQPSHCNLNKPGARGQGLGLNRNGILKLDSNSDCQMSATDSADGDGGDDSWLCSPPRSPLAMVFTAWHTFVDPRHWEKNLGIYIY